ncbi:hypothetical protein P7F88_25165 [Vibrio hannami]|uniref:hypothetical protein n=1 Tax=Vibrio hannami TaxID=2717094 RepID=UPI00240EF95C|nr:hypothetical protein [Vibrio hannami]MDG3089155.1 hypothetical protein [Vibrio hannami]
MIELVTDAQITASVVSVKAQCKKGITRHKVRYVSPEPTSRDMAERLKQALTLAGVELQTFELIELGRRCWRLSFTVLDCK